MKLKRTETQELLCHLTTEERIARGVQLGGVIQEIAALESAKAASAKEYNAQISLAQTRRDKLAEAAKTGKELQPVGCEIYADISRAAYVTVRTDTGEEIGARVMTSSELTHERQGSLPLQEPEPAAEDLPSYTTTTVMAEDVPRITTEVETITLLDQDMPKGDDPDPEKDEEPLDLGLVDRVDDWTRGETNDWLRSHNMPVPTGRGAHRRAQDLIKAVMLDDYDEPAADAAFGPLKWPGDNGSTKLRKNGTHEPSDDTDEGGGQPDLSDASGSDSEGAVPVLPLEPPKSCPDCGVPVEECSCPRL
jgi:hypothetical protein